MNKNTKLRRELDWSRQKSEKLAEALRLTIEYVGPSILPPVKGWAWFEVLNEYYPVLAESFVNKYNKYNDSKTQSDPDILQWNGVAYIRKALSDRKVHEAEKDGLAYTLLQMDMPERFNVNDKVYVRGDIVNKDRDALKQLYENVATFKKINDEARKGSILTESLKEDGLNTDERENERLNKVIFELTNIINNTISNNIKGYDENYKEILDVIINHFTDAELEAIGFYVRTDGKLYRISNEELVKDPKLVLNLATNNHEFKRHIVDVNITRKDMGLKPFAENKRADILHTAEELINGDRAQSYGPPETSFKRIAQLWNAMDIRIKEWNPEEPRDFDYRELTAVDVALVLIQLKVSRIISSPDHEDSWIDVAGYAGLGGEIATNKEKN